MSDQNDLEKLRRLGLVRTMPDGTEAVKITAQYRGAPSSSDRGAWRAQMEAWQSLLSGELANFGAQIVPDSLSLSAQTVEAVVPTRRLDEVAKKLSDKDVRVDLVVPRQVVTE